MPILDGYEATRQIVKLFAQKNLTKPIICAVTGHVEDQYIQKAMDAGMDFVISKPAQCKEIK